MGIVMNYVPNNHEFGKLMMAKQTQDLADEAAQHGAAIARLYAAGARPRLPSEYVTGFKVRTGPPVLLGDGPYANLRRTARVVNEHHLASAIEFGTGTASTAQSAGRPRPQGGYSEPHRVLGRTGSRIGAPPRKAR